MKKGVVLFAAVCCAVFTAVAVAAPKPVYKTNVHVDDDLKTLHGTLTSPKDGCLRARKVRLIDKRLDHPDTPRGKPGFSNRQGKWTIDDIGSFHQDTYAVYVKAYSAKHKHYNCAGGKSKDFGNN